MYLIQLRKLPFTSASGWLKSKWLDRKSFKFAAALGLLCALTPTYGVVNFVFTDRGPALSWYTYFSENYVDANTNLQLDINADPNSTWANSVQGQYAYYSNYGLLVSPNSQSTASFTFKFNQKVQLLGYTLTDSESIALPVPINGNESFTLSVGTQTTTQNAASGTHNFNNQLIVQANEVITLTGSNPGAGVDWLMWSALRVEIIPEPKTYAFLIGLTIFAGVLLKRRFR